MVTGERVESVIVVKQIRHFAEDKDDIAEKLVIKNNWSKKDFSNAHRCLDANSSALNSRQADLHKLKGMLLDKRQFLLTLLENPNLLEHDSFTDLLWAVFHLTEELQFRDDLVSLPDSDFKHLTGDMKRACSLLIKEWLEYMKHLKRDYPYLFSLAIRRNPFDSKSCITVY